MKVGVALSFAIIFGAIGDILMSTGMRRSGEVTVTSLRDIPSFLADTFTNPCVLAGVLSMALYFAAYITALAWVDVSVANPLTALSYVIASTYAFAYLREKIGWERAAGIMLITVGALFVGLSS